MWYGRLVTQQNPESTRASTPWLVVMAFIALVLAVMFILKLACPKPVPAAAPASAGQTTADAAEQKHDRKVAAG